MRIYKKVPHNDIINLQMGQPVDLPAPHILEEEIQAGWVKLIKVPENSNKIRYIQNTLIVYQLGSLHFQRTTLIGK